MKDQIKIERHANNVTVRVNGRVRRMFYPDAGINPMGAAERDARDFVRGMVARAFDVERVHGGFCGPRWREAETAYAEIVAPLAR